MNRIKLEKYQLQTLVTISVSNFIANSEPTGIPNSAPLTNAY